MPNPDFLKQKYDLHNAPEVESAALRHEKRTGEKVPFIPEARIQNYLDRFKEITERKDPAEREMGLRALKKVLEDKFVVKPENIPESYFENQKRLAREQGHGDIEITDEMRKQLAEVIISDQRTTLDGWIDYLASPDATYPDWLKYWTIRSILSIGGYDKEKKQFAKRSKGTVQPFPDINREALAYILDAVSQKYGKRHLDLLALDQEEKKDFEKLLESENFPKLYAWALEKLTIAPAESLANIAGRWVKYSRHSNHLPLVESLQGHGTGWCTAGEQTAQMQLQGGDFYVYYSFDKKGKPTIPRSAIRMQENQIAEIRGVAKEQNLDSFIAPVVEAKLKEFPDGEKFKKKTNDMKHLTEIERKIKAKKDLTKDDLILLYEIDQPIEGFGYQRDPRIEEIRKTRDPKEDAPIVLDCRPDQIAWKKEQINENTKAYIGPLFKGIFQRNIKNIYTSFPEERISRIETPIGGESEEKLRNELKKREELEGDDKIYVSRWAEDTLKNKDFYTLKNKEQITLIKLKVRDLGFPDGATTEQIYQKADEYGLELCPPEVGPRLRLNYEQIFKREQPRGDYFWIAMKPIADSGGRPRVFHVSRDEDGSRSWLYVLWAEPARRWYPGNEFVFRVRKFES